MHDEPVPQPGPGEVQIQIKSVGICASDLHYYRDGRIGSTAITAPIVMGHEASGVITALGAGVDSLRVGDRVAIEPAKPCGKCVYCKSGHFNVCRDVQFFGTPPVDGCLRDYIAWPAKLALKVPDALTFDEAAMVEPLAVGVYAVELASPVAGNTIMILGSGAIGLSVLQAAKVAGVGKIIVTDPVPERRKLALELGADAALDPGTIDIEQEVERLTDCRGVDTAFECAGVPETLIDAGRVVHPLGKVVVVGIPDEDKYFFEASNARRKQLFVIFVRRSNLTAERSIELIAGGKVDVKCYGAHNFTLESTADAMESAITKADGIIRAIVKSNRNAHKNNTI
ncbi:alcohol dehydrogenase catalytic domain-containing protein [bacterium]|nr:alcohol dehydrogenase catalytic domain-containing protein [bacterium]